MIIENEYIEELKEIFDENNQGYITNRKAIESDMLKVVYLENNKPLGYAIIYEKPDFCEKEKIPIKIDNISKNSIYIWQIATKKGYEKKGIASNIVKYITEKFKERDIYVCVDINNYGSMKVHCKNNFIPIKIFEKEWNGKKEQFLILKKSCIQ